MAVVAQPVKGTGLDQALHRPAVQFVAVHPLTEVIQAGIGLVPTLPHHILDQVTANVLDRVQAEADLAVLVRRKAAARNIHIRRQHLDAKADTLAGILNDLVRVVQHTGQQGGHEFAGVMALEVSGLECHIGVAGRMALVECVRSKTGHLIVDLVGDLFRNAVGHTAGALVARLGAAVHEVLSLSLHHSVLLFAHGTADVVGLPEGEARQLPEDLHDLFLIDDAAVGHIQDMGELRGLVTDLVRLVAVAQIGWDGVHGTGTVQADQSDDIFQVLRLQAYKHLLHAGRFQLEHTLGVALSQHFIGLRVVIIQLLDGELRVMLLHRRFRIADNGQGAQTQKVHLQQAQFLDLSHVELGHRQAVVGGQRQIVVGRFRRDDHARRMGGRMPRHALHLQGGVDELGDLRVGVIELFQLGGNFQCPFQGHLELHGHQFCHHVHLLIRDTHHTAHIADGVAGGHGTEGNNLRHMIGPVFPIDVINDLLPTLVAEVYVKIGHADALRVQEALEDQIVPDGVDIRDAYAVGRNAACTGTTARAHRDALTFGVIDVVPDDKVVVGVAHGFDHADLIAQAVLVGLRDIGPVPAFKTLPAELFKECLIIHAVRGFIIRDLGVAKLKVKVALFCNFRRVFAGFWHHGEQVIHFICSLDVKFVGLELHAVGILNGLAGLDAQQDGLHLGIFLAQIVGVIGGRHGDAGFPRQLDELRQNDVVLFQPMVLQLDVIIAFSEQIPIPQGRGLGPLVVPGQNGLRHLTGQTGRQADQALVILFQQLLVHAGLGIKALHERCRDHLDQVFVASLILAQQDQMVVAVDLVHLVKTGAGSHIDFTADDGLDARLFGCLIELHTAVHDAVVGAGNGGLAAFLDAVHQLVDAAGTVQQTVFRMDVQVDKVSAQVVVFADFAQGSASCPFSTRCRRASANASSFFIRCERPDLLTAGSKQPHNAVSDKSGYCSRTAAACCSTSGSVSNASFSCRYRMALRVWALARAVLPRFAVSQLVCRLVWLRTCLKAFCAWISSAAPAAPIKRSSRSRLALFLT